jgi:hypothetical protein
MIEQDSPLSEWVPSCGNSVPRQVEDFRREALNV